MSRLTGTQVNELSNALLNAFPERGALAQLVRIGLDDRLDEITNGKNLRDTVFELIEWAEARGRIAELVAAARAENFGNSTLAELTGNPGPDPSAITNYLLLLRKSLAYWFEQIVFRVVDLHGVPVRGPFDSPGNPGLMPALPGFMNELPLRSLSAPASFNGIGEAFQHFRERLLLLGPPGAGKTTALLAFADQAARRSLADPLAPLPIVVKLSTWDGTMELSEWLAAETRMLSGPAIRGLLATGRALLLLDGLDEIRDRRMDTERAPARDPRLSFLEQIPDAVPLLLTCREQDYEVLKNRGVSLPVHGAVALQPLTDAQRSSALSGFPRLSAAVERHPIFEQITRNPLMLSLMLGAYEDSTRESVSATLLTEESVRDSVIGRFLEHRLARESRRWRGTPAVTIDELYRLWGPVAMQDAGGGGNVNEFPAEMLTDSSIRSQTQDLVDLSQDLGIIYPSSPGVFSFRHMLFRDHFAFRHAQEALFSATPELRDAAAWALWQIPDRRSVLLLIRALQDPYKYARGSAASALGMIGDPAAIAPLAALLQDQTAVHSMYGTSIAEVAEWALYQIGTEDALRQLNADGGRAP